MGDVGLVSDREDVVRAITCGELSVESVLAVIVTLDVSSWGGDVGVACKSSIEEGSATGVELAGSPVCAVSSSFGTSGAGLWGGETAVAFSVWSMIQETLEPLDRVGESRCRRE